MFNRLKNKVDRSFIFRIFLSFSISVVIVFSAFTSIVILREMKRVNENLVSQGRIFSGLLAYSSRTAVFAENKAGLEGIVHGVMAQQNVLAVSVFSAEENRLIGEWQRNAKTIGPGSKLDKDIVAKLKAGSTFETVERVNAIDCFSPVVMEEFGSLEDTLFLNNASGAVPVNIIGYVVVTIDRSTLIRNLRDIVARSVILAAFVLLAGVGFVIVGLRRLTRPLTLLTEQVRYLGEGGTVEKIPVESADEIGRLATAFNTMSDDLRRRDEEKHHLEEQLRESKKMEAVGTLARGITHDFNNILTTVRGSVYMLGKKLDKDSPLTHYIKQITNSLDKAKNLTQGLIAFSRAQVINVRPLNINNLISNLAPVLEGIAGEKVHLTISLPEAPLMISGDSIQMERVLMNLCSNACDAMPDGGNLDLHAEAISIYEGDSDKYAPAEPGRYILISLTDTGIGMDDETRERIFEPFFTTKEVGRGSGLGLAIVYGIIKQHGGHILVNAQKGEGTIFRIFLPLIEKEIGDGTEPNINRGADR